MLFSVFLLSQQSESIFSLQENLIKEDKAANSNNVVLAAQSPTPEDDDEAQADGPSQDGAPGDNSAKFLI